jgi:hypothetical protein
VSDRQPDELPKKDHGGLRRARFLPVLGILVAVGVAAVLLGILAPRVACACSPTVPPLPPSPMVGVVIAVESAGVGQVKGFTLRLPDAVSYTFTLGTLENATEFSPSHLAEHQITSAPIRAFYRVENGVLVAYRLEDAPN